MVHPRSDLLILILLQVLIATALPVFELASGQWKKPNSVPDCNDDQPHLSQLSLIAAIGQTQRTSVGSPILATITAASLVSAVTQSFETNNRKPDALFALQDHSESTITIVNPALSLQTLTITSISNEQSPTATSATRNSPDTSGSINTTLQTEGNPPVQPFPTNLPTVTASTLQPIETEAPFHNTTSTLSNTTFFGTLTVPLSTFETVVVTSTVVGVPVSTLVPITAVTVVNTTFTSDGSVITTSSVGPTVITITGTALSETTIEVSSIVTGTVQTTLTSGTTLPEPTSSCIFNIPCDAQDAFQPVAITPPPANIPQRGGHPVPRLGITGMTGPIETNKFYSNFFLGDQNFPAFVIPYSMSWSQGSGNAQSWGMAISHVDDSQKVFGPPNSNIPGMPVSYYINPLGIQSIILSASELRENTVMTSDSLQMFSANIHLQPSSGSAASISFPIVQGMSFVTALYNGMQPAIQSSVFFRSVSFAGAPKAGIFKYRLTLEDGKVWLLYAAPTNGVDPNFQLISSTLLQGVPSWFGSIQISKIPANTTENLFDAACGLYPTGGALAGYASGSQAEYSLSWTKGGQYASTGTLLMFALPHHVDSFSADTRNKTTLLKLQTTTKGMATAVAADYWLMAENDLPVTMGFAPWRPGSENITTLSSAAISAIQAVAATEASQNMSAQSNLNSMYYSGKALSKFATIVYTMNDLADQKHLAAAALVQLKSAFATFVNNQQQFPLLYDTDWKGVVSSASYVTGDSGVDFGNSYYNDHHFHYGYFIHAAAIIGYLDPSWLGANKDYINILVRDTSNPSSLDQYFPISRSFDWYHGHSWAKGLYSSGDGKDEESSSEDSMYAYALKMWGRTIGDTSMEARGNLMLSVLTRSLQSYFLLDSNNKNQPASFIGNKVTGIMFENKVDHTTYFGANLEYVQGIHMIPLMPFSTLTRTTQFVVEEWDLYFADGAVAQAQTVQGGWKGILYANLAIINPTAAYNFFTQPNFDPTWLDGGASQTWYIALAAGLGGNM